MEEIFTSDLTDLDSRSSKRMFCLKKDDSELEKVIRDYLNDYTSEFSMDTKYNNDVLSYPDNDGIDVWEEWKLLYLLEDGKDKHKRIFVLGEKDYNKMILEYYAIRNFINNGDNNQIVENIKSLLNDNWNTTYNHNRLLINELGWYLTQTDLSYRNVSARLNSLKNNHFISVGDSYCDEGEVTYWGYERVKMLFDVVNGL